MDKGVAVWTFAAMAAAIAGWLYVQPKDDTPGGAAPPATASASAHAEPADLDAGVDEFADEEDAGIDDLSLDLDAGFELPDGGDAPSLDDAPKSVRFGVVLVSYRGAQGAKEDARSRDEAKKLADELAALAKEDFAAAVKRGDKGSEEDAGEMFRGILEPAPEYELFRLEKDEVSEPFDTPRGFWIAKRLK